MKLKLSIIALALFAVTSFTSCKKDYTCECVVTSDGTEISRASTTIKETKKKATDACEAMSTESGDLKSTCSIK